MRVGPSASLAIGGLLAIGACVDDHDCPTDEALVEIDEPWLLAIDEDDGSVDALVQISVEPGFEGTKTVLCPDLELPPELPADTNFTSLTNVDGTLYASALRETWGDTLVRIDPCACTATIVGGYGFNFVSGLAATLDGRMFGVAAELDSMIEIDAQTGLGEARDALGRDWGSHGLSGSAPDDDLLYGIDAETDRLYRFDARDGALLDSIALSHDFAAVGVELHPGRAELFACGVRDDDTSLYVVELDSGLVRLVADSVFTTACDNLAGPSGPIVCAQ